MKKPGEAYEYSHMPRVTAHPLCAVIPAYMANVGYPQMGFLRDEIP